MIVQGRVIDFKSIIFDESLGVGEYGMVNGGRIMDDENATVFKEVTIKMLKGREIDDSKFKIHALRLREQKKFARSQFSYPDKEFNLLGNLHRKKNIVFSSRKGKNIGVNK